MRLHVLKVRGFRSFENREFRFGSLLCGVVGVNGAGKTSLLEAISVILGAVIENLVGSNPRPLGLDDWLGWGNERVERVELEADLELLEGHRGMMWVTGTGDRNTVIECDKILRDIFATLRKNLLLAESETQFPVIAYYRTGRLWFGEDAGWLRPTERSHAYRGCLDPSLSLKSLGSWFAAESERAQTDKLAHARLLALTESLRRVLHVPGDVQVDKDRQELVYRDGPSWQPLRIMADGLRSISVIAADITWRACTLNPFLSGKAVNEGRGIILIDELDLHLHPLWQRCAIDDFRKWLWGMQVVITTHSPFVVKELHSDEVMNLDRAAVSTEGSIEDIAEEVMGVTVPQRSQRQHALTTAAERFFRAMGSPDIGHEELEALRAAYEEALRPFADDQTVLALLRLERLAAGGKD